MVDDRALPPPPEGRIWALFQNVAGLPCEKCGHIFPFYTVGGSGDRCDHRYAAVSIESEQLVAATGIPYCALTPALLALLDVPPQEAATITLYRAEEEP